MLYAALPLSASTFSFAELGPALPVGTALAVRVSMVTLGAFRRLGAGASMLADPHRFTAGADSILYASPSWKLRRCRVLAQSHA